MKSTNSKEHRGLFTKRKLSGLSNLSYVDRLHACNLPSLELRRLQIDLLLCYKIIHNLVAINFNDLFQFDTNVYCTRGHKFKLKRPPCR